MRPFIFTSDIDSLKAWNTRVHEIPSGLSDKDALLTWYARALEFPDYFGMNWDAFYECLRDLHWINDHSVVLYHRTLPLEVSPDDRRIYVEVLASAVEDWKLREFHELVVAFDPTCELKLWAVYRGNP